VGALRSWPIVKKNRNKEIGARAPKSPKSKTGPLGKNGQKGLKKSKRKERHDSRNSVWSRRRKEQDGGRKRRKETRGRTLGFFVRKCGQNRQPAQKRPTHDPFGQKDEQKKKVNHGGETLVYKAAGKRGKKSQVVSTTGGQRGKSPTGRKILPPRKNKRDTVHQTSTGNTQRVGGNPRTDQKLRGNQKGGTWEAKFQTGRSGGKHRLKK